MSVMDFVERGAAFGIQKLHAAEPGESEAERQWDAEVPVLYRKVSSAHAKKTIR